MTGKHYFKYSLIFLVAFCGCERQSPLNPEIGGLLALQLNFLGQPVQTGELYKIPAHSFTHLTVEIYANEIHTDSAIESAPIAATSIEIDPTATNFEGRLTLPAGEKRFLVARLFESVEDTTAISDSTVLSYCGKKSDLSIHPGQISEVTVDLHPVPIKNRRVVFWLESAQLQPETTTAEIPVHVAALDSIRGIQFDLVFDPSLVATDSISKREATRQFSNIQFNDIQNQGTRILLFDQTSASPWLVPLTDACAAPTSLFGIHVRVTDPNLETINISMERAIVSTRNFEDLEIFAIPARIFRESK